MPFTDEQLRAKAAASAASLKGMTAKQREQTVSDVIAKNFNTLREQVVEARPDLERLLPEALAKTAGSYGMESHTACYQDLQVFYGQITAALMPDTDSLFG